MTAALAGGTQRPATGRVKPAEWWPVSNHQAPHRKADITSHQSLTSTCQTNPEETAKVLVKANEIQGILRVWAQHQEVLLNKVKLRIGNSCHLDFRQAGVSELQAAIQDNVRRYHEAGITRGTLFWSVDYEEGIAAYLQALYDDPGFAPILATQESRQARERDRFLAVVCTENPYADVWQPAGGTCERFTAAGGQ